MQRWEDGSGRITVIRSKTDVEAQGATVAITPAAMAALSAMRPAGVASGEKVFGLSESQIARRVKTIARAAGLADWSTSADTAGASAWPRTAPPPTRSSARAAGNRAAAWSAATLAANPPDRRYGICNPISFTLITAVHHCPSPSVQGNAIDRDTRDADLSMVSTTRCF